VYQYWCGIFCGILFIVHFFFMEESRFDRSQYMAPEQQLQPVLPCLHSEAKDGSDDKFPSEGGHGDNIDKESLNNAIQGIDPSVTQTSRVAGSVYSKKSYASRLKPIEGETMRSKNIMLRLMGRPMFLLSFPIIVYAGFLYGSNITWLSVLNATQSMVLANAPYNLSTSAVGLTFLAPLVGTTLA
jgi:hypothetical protein